MPQAIDFYFDFASPYGYFASTKIDEAVAGHDGRVVWRPWLMGAVFKIAGTAPLVSYPLKGAYSVRDMARTARMLGVPFGLPEGFPHASVAAARGFYWLADQDAARAKAFARAIYKAYFVANKDISQEAVVVAAADEAGAEGRALIEATRSPAIKERLRHETDAAIARGVFGSPFFIVNGEPFWGCDKIEQVERWLATGGW